MTTKIQSLVFSRSMFGPSEARAWAKDHDFTAAKVDVQKNTVRIRQLAPSSFQKDSFRTIELRKGVKAVIGVPKVKRRPARRNPQDSEIELSVWEALDIMNEHLSGKYRGEPTFIVEHADVEVDEDEEGRSLVIWSGDITDYETGDVVGFISFMEHWPMPNVVWE